MAARNQDGVFASDRRQAQADTDPQEKNSAATLSKLWVHENSAKLRLDAPCMHHFVACGTV
jgi:hypothetical protein